MKDERHDMVIFTVFNNYNIEIVVAKDVKKARQRRSAIFGEYNEEFSALHFHNGLGNACLIFPEKNMGIVDVAHECYHAVRAMMEWASITDEETPAYVMGYLMKQVFNFVKNRKRRRKK
jgi:hypothetical protein